MHSQKNIKHVMVFASIQTNKQTNTYFTRWMTVVFEKIMVPQLQKKFPELYETRVFITVFTESRHYFLS
jgi:hypothetical protein